jgi:hypothetical protein
MNKISSRRIGLIAAGGVNQSFLARIPTVLQRVGPFKSSSFQVSRRLVNGLRAGIAVTDYRAFEGCDFIWIAMPEDKLAATVDELALHIPLEQKMIVLCDVMQDSFRLRALRIAGARVASLNCLPACDERIFAAEGDPAVLGALRQILRTDGRKLIELRPRTKGLYLSGVYLGMYALLPLIGAAVGNLRATGFSRVEAVSAVHALGTHALRAYAGAGDRAFQNTTADSLRAAILAQPESVLLSRRQRQALSEWCRLTIHLLAARG